MPLQRLAGEMHGIYKIGPASAANVRQSEREERKVASLLLCAGEGVGGFGCWCRKGRMDMLLFVP